ncbi:hypothetical protein F3157_02765 [Virgibacillus dakarensis]|nr:hypothetical protein [Virgibacillus dakarensis]
MIERRAKSIQVPAIDRATPKFVRATDKVGRATPNRIVLHPDNTDGIQMVIFIFKVNSSSYPFAIELKLTRKILHHNGIQDLHMLLDLHGT